MTRLVGLLAALCQATATAGSPGLWEAVVGLADGFLADGLLEGCIRDSKRAVGGFDAAVSDLERGGAVHTLKGLKELADSLRGVPDVLRECKAAEEDVKQAVNALAQLRDPREFAFHVGKDLVVNHRDIYTEITGAVTAYKAQQYLRFGLDVGTALRKLVVGVEEQFLEFERLHNKTYHSPQERESRLAIFASNLDEIFDLGKVEQGTAVYSHLTPFADMTPEEFSARLGLKATDGEGADAPLAEALETSTLPDSFDWRAKGAVNPVKNQEQCGSCWAFATVANIEGAGFVSTGRLVSLSEQELVDCDHQTGDEGCGGGLPSNAFKDMIQQQLGLELEAAYPYAAKDGTCRASASSEVAFIGGWKQVSQDEDQIAAALVQYGPLAIGINAGPMQWYSGGIAHPWRLLCNPTKLDHGVAIVAFGAQGTKKYWTIRNSWGPSWGEQGYYRIVRGAGACGLNTMVTTATGVTIKSAMNRELVV